MDGYRLLSSTPYISHDPTVFSRSCAKILNEALTKCGTSSHDRVGYRLPPATSQSFKFQISGLGSHSYARDNTGAAGELSKKGRWPACSNDVATLADYRERPSMAQEVAHIEVEVLALLAILGCDWTSYPAKPRLQRIAHDFEGASA